MKCFEPFSLLCNDISILLAKKFARDANRLYYKKVYDVVEGNTCIRKAIIKGEPCMIARCGTVECQAIYKYLHDRHSLPIGAPILDVLCNNAGFFPKDEKMWHKFGDLMLDCMSYVDYQAVMWSGGGENYLLKRFAPQAVLLPLKLLDPIYGWTEALENKKVLVVHPFVDTIRSQYEIKRDSIFKGTNYLPRFELKTIKAVQTIAGTKDERFSTWFEALDYMTDEISKVDFDVALIGCGAYGYPLAARVKQMGKIAIHMGGATQLLFGIMGRRWENNPRILKWVNNYWVRPSEAEIPLSFHSVENGCYW